MVWQPLLTKTYSRSPTLLGSLLGSAAPYPSPMPGTLADGYICSCNKKRCSHFSSYADQKSSERQHDLLWSGSPEILRRWSLQSHHAVDSSDFLERLILLTDSAISRGCDRLISPRQCSHRPYKKAWFGIDPARIGIDRSPGAPKRNIPVFRSHLFIPLTGPTGT